MVYPPGSSTAIGLDLIKSDKKTEDEEILQIRERPISKATGTKSKKKKKKEKPVVTTAGGNRCVNRKRSTM